MNDENLKVLTNIIGAVESGGQVYGKRRYDAYTAPYTNSPKEVTVTLGWAQFYGGEAYKLVSLIYAKNPEQFDLMDPQGSIKTMINGEHDWVTEKWKPNYYQKCILLALIDSESGHAAQDELFAEQMKKYISDCEKAYTGDARAEMMYCEIRHLGGKSAADRIFKKCGGDYSLDRIMSVLKADQSDTSSNNQVGDKRYWSRHEKCCEFIKKYAVSETGKTSQKEVKKLPTAEQVVNKAASYIGTTELPAGSNNVIFNTDYYGHAVSGSDYPWCCAFVWDIFRMCGGSSLFGEKTAACAEYEQNAISRGESVGKANGRKGDVVTFDFGHKGYAHHIGFIKSKNADGTYQTIEGNTSKTSQDNGGAVMERTRSQSDMRYIFRPKYSGAASSTVSTKTSTGTAKGSGYMFAPEQIKLGSKNNSVLLAQEILKARGLYTGDLDKDFGSGTKAAVVKYQKARGLDPDGIVGPKTWADMIAI